MYTVKLKYTYTIASKYGSAFCDLDEAALCSPSEKRAHACSRGCSEARDRSALLKKKTFLGLVLSNIFVKI